MKSSKSFCINSLKLQRSKGFKIRRYRHGPVILGCLATMDPKNKELKLLAPKNEELKLLFSHFSMCKEICFHVGKKKERKRAEWGRVT
jgi:hypothetical protein